MSGNQRSRHWPLRRFVVVGDSMLPGLNPGDGLLGLRGGTPRTGQLRVFPNPDLPMSWVVKRVGHVSGATFEACSDNPRAAGATDSRHFGRVPAAGTYRVIWTFRAGR